MDLVLSEASSSHSGAHDARMLLQSIKMSSAWPGAGTTGRHIQEQGPTGGP